MEPLQLERQGGRCILRLAGEVRLGDARQLFERVLEEQGCDSVLLDFASAEVEDRALQLLADLLSHAHLRVAVSGLRERQLRLLQYLGAASAEQR